MIEVTKREFNPDLYGLLSFAR